MEIRHKYFAKPTTEDGIRFASKKESRYYLQLQMAQKSGELLFFLRQTPFHLPGNVRYVVDFTEFWKDGTVRFTDVKGFKTRSYLTKKKMVEALFPIQILEV